MSGELVLCVRADGSLHLRAAPRQSASAKARAARTGDALRGRRYGSAAEARQAFAEAAKGAAAGG